MTLVSFREINLVEYLILFESRFTTVFEGAAVVGDTAVVVNEGAAVVGGTVVVEVCFGDRLIS